MMATNQQWQNLIEIFFLSCLALAVATTALSSQEIVVDPADIGATDVEYGPDPTFAAPLTNPIESPLDLGETNKLWVGNSIVGELLISNGGMLSAPESFLGYETNSTGVVTVDGSGSIFDPGQLLYVGYRGTGALTVRDGGLITQLTSTGSTGVPTFVGYESGSDGSVLLQGSGTKFEPHTVVIGHDAGAQGLLTVADGAVIEGEQFGGISIGFDLDSEGDVVVAGPGSKIDAQSASSLGFDVGRLGEGTLTVSNGGLVQSVQIDIAAATPGNDSKAIIDGPGSKMKSVRLFVGSVFDPTDAILEIKNGARVETEDLALSTFSSPSGEIFIDSGATLHVEDELAYFANSIGAPHIHIDGGILSLAGDRTYDPGNGSNGGLNGFFARHDALLTTGEQIRIGGDLTISSNIEIVGGHIAAKSISDFNRFNFQFGTLELTASGLEISAGGDAGSVFSVNTGQHWIFSDAVFVADDGRLTMDGGHLTTPIVENFGLIVGAGDFTSALVNRHSGSIQVTPGQEMRFLGTATDNHGAMTLLGGASIEFDNLFTNRAAGMIVGRGTIDAFNGMTNRGLISFSAGSSEIFGELFATSTSEIEIRDNSASSFFDEVENEGRLFVDGSSGAFFFGSLDLGNSSDVEIEIGTLSEQYNRIEIASNALLDGQLSIRLASGYLPDSSDKFTVVAAGNLSGQFDNIANGERLSTIGGGSFVVNYGPGSPYGSSNVVLTEFEAGNVMPGDVNGDGAVNLLDVQPFIDAVTNGNYIPAADINQDGSVNLLDVQPFVELLTS